MLFRGRKRSMDMAENNAPERNDLVSRSEVLKAIAGHIAGYDDHYMHCLIKCIPELIEKLPSAHLAAPDAAQGVRLSLDDTGNGWYHVVREDNVIDGKREVVYSSADRMFCELLVSAVNLYAASRGAVRQARQETEDDERANYQQMFTDTNVGDD